MSSSNNYIIVTESQNMSDDVITDEVLEAPNEQEDVSLRTLESQGVAILERKESPETSEPRDQFSHELLDEAGIEIVESEDEDTPLP